MPVIIGTSNPETLSGTADADEIYGLRGDDVLGGLDGDDIVYWRAGTYAGASDDTDTVDGGAGIDRLAVIANVTARQIGNEFYEHFFRLEPGANGVASWSMRSVGINEIPPHVRTDTFALVGMRNVETFSFHDASLPAFVGHKDNIFVGDLRGTELTGQLFFDLGGQNDLLDAAASYNRIVANGREGRDALIGGAGDDELIGGVGNDQLTGNGGANTLIGGQDDDTYMSENRFDTIIELAGEGTDYVRTHAPFYILLSVNVENLTYLGTGDFTGMGNAQNNVIEGAAGNDYLIGLGGDDVLHARGGLNALQGGTGDDTYHTDSLGDSIYELAGEGIDTIVTGLNSYALPSTIENLRMTSSAQHVTATGNALDNFILGGSFLFGLEGNDVLDSGSYFGHHVMDGGVGDDTYRLTQGDDQIVERPGEGNDTVELYARMHGYTLPTEFENLAILYANDPFDRIQSTDARGNGADNRITGGIARDKIAGDAGNDTLNGAGNGDFLSGDSGDDRLNGGLGADELAGGTGADVFAFDNADKQDMVHDFSRAEGDKIDVAALLASVGYAGGASAFDDGYLRIVAVPSIPPSGATRLQFDPDGAAGPQSFRDVALFLGGTAVVDPQDFIFG